MQSSLPLTFYSFCNVALTLLIASSPSDQTSGVLHLERESRRSVGRKEFCRWESFNVTCPLDGVIVIRSADYGRMRYTRCTEMTSHIGCFADVILHLDDICSGRRHCSVPVPNQELHEIQPCPKDMQTYLEVDYECIKVQTGHNCQPTYHIEADRQNGHLSSLIMEETLQGTELCPWLIRVPKGQRINVTMMDFGVLRNKEADSSVCDKYATVKEGNKQDLFCGGKERIRRVYMSDHNEIQITLIKQPIEKLRRRFLLAYEAVGCPDVTASGNSWIQRKGERMDVGCNNSKQTWHLVCKGTEWVGDISNCSWDGTDEALTATDLIYPYGLLFSVAIGILLGICVGGCLLTVVLSCRQRRLAAENCEEDCDISVPYFGTKLHHQQHHHQQQQQQPFYFDDRRLHDSTYAGGTVLSGSNTAGQDPVSTGLYTHVCELRRNHQAQPPPPLLQSSCVHTDDVAMADKHLLQMDSSDREGPGAAGARNNRTTSRFCPDDSFRISAKVEAASTEIAFRHFYERPDVSEGGGAGGAAGCLCRPGMAGEGGPVYNEVSPGD